MCTWKCQKASSVRVLSSRTQSAMCQDTSVNWWEHLVFGVVRHDPLSKGEALIQSIDKGECSRIPRCGSRSLPFADGTFLTCPLDMFQTWGLYLLFPCLA